MKVLRTKSIEQSLEDTEDVEFKLKKELSALDLTVFGIGVVIGAGIFTLTGRVANQYAGPGVVFSFALAAICCGLAAVCYAEFASTVPVAGSAYTFSYATLGELVAWIIGWDLILELMLGASVVAQGWSTYLVTFLDEIGITWPASVGPADVEDFTWGHINLAAVLLVVALTTLIAIGIKESLRVNLVLVAIKLFVVLFVIIAGLFYVSGANYDPFIPPASDPINASGLDATADPVGVRARSRRPSASSASSPQPRWSSSPTSASTSWPRPPRRRRTRRRTCRRASSARSRSAPCSTWRSRW